MIVVSDTTAISSLHKIAHLHLLKEIFTEVVIPAQVYDELKYFEKIQPGFDLRRSYPWISIETVKDTGLIQSLEEILDAGESSAIALSIQLHADLLLIDEKLGRKIAREKGLSVVGLMGVLEIAKKRKIVPFIKPLMDDLIRVANFRISKLLYERTLEAVNEK